MGLFDKVRALLPLAWTEQSPEVKGEKTYLAIRGNYSFWVKKEPHETKWTCVVTDHDGDPVDLKVDVKELSEAKKWCEEW